jgi:osmotically-inducible protein OsmY
MREREKAGREPHRTAANREHGAAVASSDLMLLGACQQALVADPALAGCVIGPGSLQDSERRRILGTEGLDGRITVEVKGGVVLLEGEVPSLGHKRLAGVLARRSVGCRAVVNRLAVGLLEEDSDQERETAVRLALSRDPALDPRTIRVRVRGAAVLLEGTVDSPLKALAAESDAGSVFGVERVDNRLVVDPRERGKA